MATLIAPANPSPVEDAEAIRKAVHGFGTDEKKLISIIGHRNAVQRKLLRQSYEQIYQEDLIKRLESELHGNLEKAMYRWILDPLDRDAVLANVAMKDPSNPDYCVIIEISCIYSPEELLAVKRAYQARFHHCLEEDLASHLSGDLGKFLVALAGVYRYDGGEIDPRLAKAEAAVLHNAIKDRNHDEITRIVGTRSKAQLIATFNCYKDEHGTSITKDLVKVPGNPYLAAVSLAARCIKDPKRYHEKLLRDALQNHGADENVLTRVIVRRAEKDLKEIKELYYKRNSVTLDQAVAKETSGDYKSFLLTLLGKEN